VDTLAVDGWAVTSGTARREQGRGRSPPRPLFTVPNVTALPSTVSVPITVLLYNGLLLFRFSMPIKGLKFHSTQYTLFHRLYPEATTLPGNQQQRTTIYCCMSRLATRLQYRSTQWHCLATNNKEQPFTAACLDWLLGCSTGLHNNTAWQPTTKNNHLLLHVSTGY